MSPSRQQHVLVLAGGVFFALVAPPVAVVATVFPLLLLAFLGTVNPLLPIALPFAMGSIPALLAGMLYVPIATRMIKAKAWPRSRFHTLAGALCALCFAGCFLLLALSQGDIGTLRDLGLVLIPTCMLAFFAAVGGNLTARLFTPFVRRVGLWPETPIATASNL